MISKEGVSYSGHVSIYNGKEVVGGNSNMHISQAKVVYLYVADETKRKEVNNEKCIFLLLILQIFSLCICTECLCS